ncbi:HEPN domain-containing protein [Thermococcus sp.]|uniref:HEPN domain-containing protein n=1 Tax=Thermococcus sp. TaxID=35749 RepID=UPI00261E007D|nr:HEPN domain-containing protein [Thermococcus sp.]
MKEIPRLIEKAKRSIEAAKVLYDAGMYGFAALRAYYAMFYCAEALLLTRGIRTSKHSVTIALLGREFVKSGEVPYKFFTYLTVAFEIRQIGDYSVQEDIPPETVFEQIRRAEEFLSFTADYLRKKGLLEG